MYEDILFPFDGSEGAITALHHASEIAHWSDATITVLFVADTNRDSITLVEDQVVDALIREGKDIVKQAEKKLENLGVEYDTTIVQGTPATAIDKHAEQHDFNLILIPSHGHEGVSRYLLGSVSEKVVRISSIPVLTVRMQPDEQLAFPYENILIPTDGSDAAAYAARHGLSFAAALDATVHALSVIDDTPLGIDVRSIVASQDYEQMANQTVEDLVAEAESHGVTNTKMHTEQGTPIEIILDYIQSNDIDAVVMGATGRRGTEQIMFGSVAEKTVRSAPVPVMTVAEPS